MKYLLWEKSLKLRSPVRKSWLLFTLLNSFKLWERELEAWVWRVETQCCCSSLAETKGWIFWAWSCIIKQSPFDLYHPLFCAVSIYILKCQWNNIAFLRAIWEDERLQPKGHHKITLRSWKILTLSLIFFLMQQLPYMSGLVCVFPSSSSLD